jgi:regulator of sigma E protease
MQEPGLPVPGEQGKQMQFLSWLYVIAAVVLLFGASVFVHEFGHFWAARRRGLKIEGFSIGFGPKLFGWTRNGIDYAWRWIPAGGFVKLPQMLPGEGGEIEGKEKLPPISPLSKILVAIAGPIMNLVFGFAIATALFFLGLPMLVNPPIVGEVAPGSPEAALGIRPGDRILAVNGEPVHSWQEVQMTTAMARTNVVPVRIEHDGLPSTYYLHAKMNEEIGLKVLNLLPKESPVIQQVFPGSPAAQVGLKPGDILLSYSGVPIAGPEQLVSLIQKSPGKPTPMTVQRGKNRLVIMVTPHLNPNTKTRAIGVMTAPSTTTVYELKKPGPLPWTLVGQVFQQTYGTISAIIHSKQTGVQAKDLSGPPGILAMLAIEVKTDYRLALKFMVLLNVSLAILNLLPLPVLDGGHVFLAVIELLRGRPVSARLQESVTMLFAVLLISFMVYVSYNDVVKRFPLFRSLLKQKVHIEPGAEGTNSPAQAR